MNVQFKKLTLSLAIASSIGFISQSAKAEGYYGEYKNSQGLKSSKYQDLINTLTGSKAKSLYNNSFDLVSQNIKYDLYNKNGGLSCTGFVNKVLKDSNINVGIDLSTHITHKDSPYVKTSSSRSERWAGIQYNKLRQFFDVYEKKIIHDAQGRVIKVENPGFRPKKGDILVYPSRHMRKTDKFYSTGHIVIVVDPQNCIAVNSTAWTYDYTKYQRDTSKKGVYFQKVGNKLRCKDGVWYGWDSTWKNQFWTMLRPKDLVVSTQVNPEPIDTPVERVEPQSTPQVPQVTTQPQTVVVPETSINDQPVQHPENEIVESVKKTHLLAISKYKDDIIWKSKQLSMENICQTSSLDDVYKVLEIDGEFVKIEIIRTQKESKCSGQKEFYMFKTNLKLVNYITNSNEIKLSSYTVKANSLLYLTPEENSSVTGFTKEGEDFVVFQAYLKDNILWLQTNKNLHWLRIDISSIL